MLNEMEIYVLSVGLPDELFKQKGIQLPPWIRRDSKEMNSFFLASCCLSASSLFSSSLN
jgi:hypothetical protein